MSLVFWLWCSAAAWAGRASKVPALASLLAQEGWLVPPELPGLRPGFVLEEGEPQPVADCGGAPTSSPFSSPKLVPALQTGVLTQAGLDVFQRVSFRVPVQWSMPEPAQGIAPACADSLLSAWSRGLDLKKASVVREVLVAPITEQTCGRFDKKGRFRALEPAEIAQVPTCARRGSEPVVLGYRAVPVASLSGLFEPAPAPRAQGPSPEEAITLDRYVLALSIPLTGEYAVIAQQKRTDAISRLNELLPKAEALDTRAEMLLRLGEAHLQEGLYLSARDKTEGARPLLMEAARVLQDLLTHHPRYERRDQATFLLGRALWTLDRRDEAVESFKQLIKLYPDSDYIADGYAWLGEHLRDSNPHGALKAFQKAATYLQSPVRGYALHQLARAAVAVGEQERAAQATQELVAWLNEREPEEPYLSLRTAVYRALTGAAR